MKITQAATRTFARQAARANTPAFQMQQQRGILGISSAIDTRLYRAAKGVMPNISATEQTALGWYVKRAETYNLQFLAIFNIVLQL